MQTSIIDFVLKEHIDPVVPTDVEVVNSSAQTGDSMFFIIALLLLLAAGILAYLNYKKFFSWNPSVEGAKHALVIEPSSLKTVYIAAATIFACAICVMCLGFSQKAIADQTKVPNDEPQHVKAYVDENTGEVTFDTSKLTNTSGAMIHLDNLIVSKNEDIEDGDCNWTFTYQDNVLYDDKADGKKHAVDKPIDIAAGASCDIELGSTIDSDIAISLIGKSVLTVSYELNPGNILSWEKGSHISQVTDSKGNVIPNGSRVVEGSALKATVTNDITTSNFVFKTENESGIIEKDCVTKYGADFTMPLYNTKIYANEVAKQFYATYNSDTSELAFYYKDLPSELNANDVTVYTQDQLVLDNPTYEDWPYYVNSENILSVVIDPTVENFHGLRSTSWMFAYQENVKEFSGFEYLQTENVVDMSSMFRLFGLANTTLNEVPDVSKWNMSKVENISYIFSYYAARSTKLTKVPDVENWDIGNVKDLSYAFYFYNSIGLGSILDCVPNVSNWDTKSVTNMAGVFENYAHDSQRINDLPNVSSWNTSQVTNMKDMFNNIADMYGAWDRILDLSSFDTRQVTEYSKMLYVWADKIIIGENWTLSMVKAKILPLDPSEYFLINGQTKCKNEEELDDAIASWKGSYPIEITRSSA